MRVLVHRTASAAASSAAAGIAEAVDLHNKGAFNLALSGGATPPKVFRALERMEWRLRLGAKLRLFWIDERCVPLQSERSNAGSAKKHMRTIWSRARVFPMCSQSATATWAKSYDRVLAAHGGDKAFDLALIGLGPDGHVASLFPNAEIVSAGRRVLLVKGPDSSQRLTVKLPVLRGAKSQIVVASGAEKAWPIAEAIKGCGGAPFAQACGGRENVWVHMDRACAEELWRSHNIRIRPSSKACLLKRQAKPILLTPKQ